MRKRQQACHTVHGGTEVIAVAPFRRADVDRHAHGEAVDGRPVARSKRLLRSDGRIDRVGGKIERSVKPIAGGLENVTTLRGDGIAQDLIVLAQRLLHGRAMVQPAQARSFDVGEQERYDIGTAAAARRYRRVKRIGVQLPRYAHRTFTCSPGAQSSKRAAR